MAKSRKRIAPIWRPVWTKPIENWTRKVVGKNMWRFDPIDELDDILQEARLLFLILWSKYPIVKDPRHFFALYKTSLTRMFIDKSRARTKDVISRSVSADDIADSMQGDLPNLGSLAVCLDEMPDELKTVLQVLTSGRIRVRVDRPTSKVRQRENANMRLKRKLSLTTDDPVGDLKTYLLNS